ncbi:MAG TPA: 5-methyltetrahydropteroyltriglutamate--homocysteine S-methyltransferase, partial [Burkholderiales bacterium]|nr:5-methyltetrahydropteroyltriglutamate--homocysteine S-methyltransferase [Burkholderiales bacterium]
MAVAHNLGFPRMGKQRELKRALESFWRRDIDDAQLQQAAVKLRRQHWLLQRDSGVNQIPCGDFALYDHMLNMSVMLGAIPERFGYGDGAIDLDAYFALARGTPEQPALEMTKWFDTNYHYLVPEFTSGTAFRPAADHLYREVAEAKYLGISPKAVLVGPITYLCLGKEKAAGFERLSLLDELLSAYRNILAKLAALGVEWVQIDEPALATDLPEVWWAALDRAYAALSGTGVKLLLTTYFGGVDDHATQLKALPVAGLHIDLCRAPDQLNAFVPDYPRDKVLSLGVIDGRNIWRADLEHTYTLLERVHEVIGERLWVAPSCSLLHCPVDLDLETKLDPELSGWLAFAVQKLREMVTLARGLNDGRQAIEPELRASVEARRSRSKSARIHNPDVRRHVACLSRADTERQSAFAQRRTRQHARFKLPLFPTTTIGSFPQTPAIRKARAAFRRGEIGYLQYLETMRAEIKQVIERQEALGLDVLVHGEAERNDMVEYFGEQLSGIALSGHGWVQSYGSRCVKPPIIFGDVSRPEAMTVDWIKYAQSLTAKPVKGMLTGPVTILQWSFVRDDQPRCATALQIALAIRDEVADLERAGIGMIQIDEPALREGLPLRRAQRDAYLQWAVQAFRVASSGVRDDVQIHTHMCYSEFNDILPAIAALDADVITI